MFWFYLLLVLLTLVLGYVMIVLCGGNLGEKGSRSCKTTIDDFIDDAEDEDDVSFEPSSNANNKYLTRYVDPGRQVLILFGTEYGFAQEISQKLFDAVAGLAEDMQPRLVNAKNHKLLDFTREKIVLCVFSTTGDGVPPTDARDFISSLSSSAPPTLSHLQYSVLALGDSNYPHFCRTGRDLDTLLSSAGCQCLVSRVDIDQEDWLTIDSWIKNITDTLSSIELALELDYLDLTNQGEEEEGVYTRTRPLMAEMIHKRPLTVMKDQSDKETIHCEFDLAGLAYTSGDALGIYPRNNPSEVSEVVVALHAKGEELVKVPSHAPSVPYRPTSTTISLYDALLGFYDLKSVRVDLLKALLRTVSSIEEKDQGSNLLSNGLSRDNSILSKYLSDHEVVDVLRDFPSHSCPPQEFLNNLKPLQPRYYSIASSPTKGLSRVSICAAVIRYQLYRSNRTGVCTTYLQDRLEIGGQVPVFISPNPDFRLPQDPSLPIIMIGPGTGISPFRAFIQERESNSGKNLLYFGCRHRNKDYLYKEELEAWSRQGTVTLRVAFSRDQDKKIYVQDLIREDAEMTWNLIKNGGHLYVCGDAKYMAPDVHKAIIDNIINMSSCTSEEALEYMEKMEREGRYQRDVWVT